VVLTSGYGRELLNENLLTTRNKPNTAMYEADGYDAAAAIAAEQEAEVSSNNAEEKKYEEDLYRERERQKYEAEVFSSGESLFVSLFEEYPDSEAGKELSRAERQVNQYLSASLSYSEVQYAAFHKIFTRLNRLGFSDENDGVFVDVGSGVGKAVFAAALFHNFKKVVGIEILTSLNKASLGVLEKWREMRLKRRLPAAKHDLEVSLLLGDALYMNWAIDAAPDVVFINATCFNSDMVRLLGVQLCRLRPGSFVIITSQPLDAIVDPRLPKYLELVLTEAMEVSFGGSVAVYFYKRALKVPSLGAIEDTELYVRELLSGERRTFE